MEKYNTMREISRPEKTRHHQIIKVGEGVNFQNSNYPFWGVSENNREYIDNWINAGDILWFCQETSDTFKVIGMSEYTHAFDSIDEPLIQLNIVEKEKQNWDDRVVNDIQIHYKNLYNTGKQSISIEKYGNEISTYGGPEGKFSNDVDLFKHYDGFKFYAEPK